MIEWIPVIVAEVAVGQGEHLNPISDLAGQFGVNWKFLFAQIANFCIVAFLLYKFAFKPVISSIDERQKKIADGLQYAEEMKHKLAETEKQHKKTLKEAQHEAQKIIAEARESSKIIIDRQEAIETCLSKMDSNSILLILGKGAENYQEINGELIHHSDQEIINNYFNEN